MPTITATPAGPDTINLNVGRATTTVDPVDLIRLIAEAAGLDVLIGPMDRSDVVDYTGYSGRAIENYAADGTMPAVAARFGGARVWELPEIHDWFVEHRRTFQRRTRYPVPLKAIARRAGVNDSTVADALLHGTGSPATVARIRRAAADLGWEAA